MYNKGITCCVNHSGRSLITNGRRDLQLAIVLIVENTIDYLLAGVAGRSE